MDVFLRLASSGNGWNSTIARRIECDVDGFDTNVETRKLFRRADCGVTINLSARISVTYGGN
jgi:hypothetical protein